MKQKYHTTTLAVSKAAKTRITEIAVKTVALINKYS